jgi:hypothetical protein
MPKNLWIVKEVFNATGQLVVPAGDDKIMHG